MAASPSSSTRPSPPPRSSPLFTPIPELEKEEEDEETEPGKTAADGPYMHSPTPLHPSSSSSSSSFAKSKATKKPTRSSGADDDFDDRSVSCNKCRPTARDKISIVPLDINSLKNASTHSPITSNIFRSLFLTLTRKSPKSTPTTSASSTALAAAAAREEEWKLAAAELSRKLLQATRKRDEALVEASKLKYSMSELERKLDRLESYCHDLKSDLDRSGPTQNRLTAGGARFTGSLPIEPFLRAVSDARTAVRHLSRSLWAQLRQGSGPRSLDRIATLLQPDEVRAGHWRKNPVFYIDALLNRVFYAEFESLGEDEGRVVNPLARCAANRAAYEAVRGLVWEEVLSKGTRHYSEGLSRFCDQKMSEVVGMLGWARAWPEALLQAFFGAAKGVWMVHLLARLVHPAVPILRVERGVGFDAAYMEDAAGERGRCLTPVSVRMMVAPGFYVYSSSCGVVKCKVLCGYNNTGGEKSANNNNSSSNNHNKKKNGCDNF